MNFQNCTESGDNVTPTARVRTSAISVLLRVRYSKL
jgi:hypothetical protein